MAGEWIKWTKGLTRKREVLAISARVGCSPQQAAATCMEVWEWADDQTADGRIDHVDLAVMGRTLGCGESFLLAMVKVGWLLEESGGVRFVNFTRHNGASAVEECRKKSAREADRIRKSAGKILENSRKNSGKNPESTAAPQRNVTSSVTSVSSPVLKHPVTSNVTLGRNVPKRDLESGGGNGQRTSQEKRAVGSRRAAFAARCSGGMADLADDSYVEQAFRYAVELEFVPDSVVGRQTVFAAAEQTLLTGKTWGLFGKLVCEDQRGITNLADKGAENRIKRFIKGEPVTRRNLTPLLEVHHEDGR